jgi:hypothetical protein
MVNETMLFIFYIYVLQAESQNYSFWFLFCQLHHNFLVDCSHQAFIMLVYEIGNTGFPDYYWGDIWSQCNLFSAKCFRPCFGSLRTIVFEKVKSTMGGQTFGS